METEEYSHLNRNHTAEPHGLEKISLRPSENSHYKQNSIYDHVRFKGFKVDKQTENDNFSHNLNNIITKKDSLIASMLNSSQKENDEQESGIINPTSSDNHISNDTNMFKDLSKYCIFCYSQLSKNLSQLYIADFCSPQCLEIFLPKLSIHCFLCKKILIKEAFGQYCLKLENRNIRQFCGEDCLEKFNPLAHYCYHCHKDLSNPAEQPLEFNLLPLNFQNDLSNLKLEDMQTEYFCNQDCLSAFEVMQNAKMEQIHCGYCEIAKCTQCKTENKPIGQCFVVPYDESARGSTLSQLCSSQCILSFLGEHKGQLIKSLTKTLDSSINTNIVNCCEYCGLSLNGLSSMTVLTLQGKSHFFCRGSNCAQAYKDEQKSIYHKDENKSELIRECFWCKTRNFTSQMLTLSPDDSIDPLYFCGKNCLALYKMDEVGELTLPSSTTAGGADEEGEETEADDILRSREPKTAVSVKFCDNCQKIIKRTPTGYSQFYVASKDSADGLRKEFCTFQCMAQFKISRANAITTTTLQTKIDEGGIGMPQRLMGGGDDMTEHKNDNLLGSYPIMIKPKINRGEYHHSSVAMAIHHSRPRGRPPILSKNRRGRPSKSNLTSYHNFNSTSSFQHHQSHQNHFPRNGIDHNKNYSVTSSATYGKIDRDEKNLNNDNNTTNFGATFKILMDILKKSNSPPSINLASATLPSPNFSIGIQTKEDITSSSSFAHPANLVWPQAPKDVKNKSTSVKPLLRSQGTNTMPIIGSDSDSFNFRALKTAVEKIDREIQTDEGSRKIVPLPIPIPFFVPIPLHAYTSYTPVPIGLPVPILVPIFIPTTATATKDIKDYFQGLKDKTNAALQKEMLAMAEMVSENDQMNPGIEIPEGEGEEEVRLKPLKGTPGYNATAAFHSNTNQSTAAPISRFHKFVQQQSLSGLGLAITPDMSMQQFSEQPQHLGGSSGMAMQQNQQHSAASTNSSTLEDLYVQIAAGGGILSITTANGDQIAVLPIQNSDGSITYASIDPNTGTLTPLDSGIIQRQLLELQLAAQIQQQQQNQQSIVDSATSSSYRQQQQQEYSSLVKSSMQQHETTSIYNNENAAFYSTSNTATVSAIDEASSFHGGHHTPSATPALTEDTIVSQRILRSGANKVAKRSVDELVNKWALIDFSPPYTFSLELSARHLEPACGVGAFKFWARAKNTIAANQIASSASSSVNLNELASKVQLMQEDPVNIPINELVDALAYFVQEIRKPDGSNYTSDSVYYFCLGIQCYLNQNGRMGDNVFADTFYGNFTDALNEVLLLFEPQITSEGVLLSRIDEKCLWESLQLGALSPHVLLNTLLYFNTKFFHLTTLEAHMALSFSHIVKLQEEMEDIKDSGQNNDEAVKRKRSFLRYYPQGHTHLPDGQAAPFYDVNENLVDTTKCPVRLYEFYLSKCPEESKIRTDNLFYLLPDKNFSSSEAPFWYLNENLSPVVLAKMFNRIFIVKETLESNITL